MASPTIQRRRLGNALRRAREEAGKTQDEAAAHIDAAASKISRLELGQSGVKLTDLRLLLAFYGVAGDQAELMRDLARAGRQRGRWTAYAKAIPDWFRAYIDLEADATELHWYQPELVPGILQVESYMRAMNLAVAQPGTGGRTEEHVTVRRARQALHDQDPPPDMRFILSESAIRRRIGSDAVMSEQLLHLARMAKRPNISIRVLPFDTQTIGAAWAGFTIMRFDHDTASDVVYLEDYTDATYLDSPDEVSVYLDLWHRLQDAALNQVESRSLILRQADSYK